VRQQNRFDILVIPVFTGDGLQSCKSKRRRESCRRAPASYRRPARRS
jgi:hypothetical protein